MEAAPDLQLVVHPGYAHALSAPPDAVSFWERRCCNLVLHQIASFLDARTLASLALVNHRCRAVAADEGLWRALCMSQFGAPPHLPPAAGTASWREVYRFNRDALRWLLGQSAAEALAKLGVRARGGGGFVLPSRGITA